MLIPLCITCMYSLLLLVVYIFNSKKFLVYICDILNTSIG